jgi:hypothetical protein
MWDHFKAEPKLVIPTFGNWKKENLMYVVDTDP